MNDILALPIMIPVLTAALCMITCRRCEIQRVISAIGGVALFVASLAVFSLVRREGIVVLAVGGWPPPFGIALVADLLSAIMLVIASFASLACLAFGLGTMDSDREAFGFHPLYHVMMMGVCGSFLTGDLFNLFVWFEVLLISSFVLLALGGEKRQIVGAIKYVAINLVASSVFLSALGLLYGATGTLNMADLAVRVRDFEPAGFITALSMMFLAAFGVKAGVFPFFFWLPASYHTPPPVVSAVFAGLLTKVGVYALVRTFTLIFVTDPEFVHTVLLWVAGSTMVVGGLGAIAQDNFRRVLSFLLISHIGNMVLGLAFMTQAGLAATVYYTAHHMITKTALFLIAGTLALWFGTDRLDAQGGLFDRRRGMAILFLLAAFALAGIPPFSGFYGKVGLLQAATEQGQWALVAASVASSFLTLVAVLKLWNESFWRSGPKPGKIRAPLGPVAGLVGAGLLLGLAAGPAYQLADDTARQLMDTQSYIRAVLGDR